MVKVIVPTQLRGYTGGRADVTAAGATLHELLADLDRQFPGFRFRVIDEHDRVRQHIIFFVGMERQEDVRAAIPAGPRLHSRGALRRPGPGGAPPGPPPGPRPPLPPPSPAPP